MFEIGSLKQSQQRRKYKRLRRRLRPFDVWLNERPRTDADIALVRRVYDEIERQAEHPEASGAVGAKTKAGTA